MTRYVIICSHTGHKFVGEIAAINICSHMGHKFVGEIAAINIYCYMRPYYCDHELLGKIICSHLQKPYMTDQC